MYRISIITVVYNQILYISDCLDSIRAQTQRPFEYIVVDGASTDGTLSILEESSDVISHLISEKDSGIYNAMNKGVARATGDFILLVNSDDWLEPEAIEIFTNVLSKNPQVSAVYGSMRVWSKVGTVVGTYRSRESMSDYLAAPFNHPALLVSKMAYEKIGLYDERFQTAADYDFMLRLKRSCAKYVFVDHVISNFRRVGITSRSSRPPTKQIWYIFQKNNVNLLLRLYAIGYREARWLLKKLSGKFENKRIHHKVLTLFSKIDRP